MMKKSIIYRTAMVLTLLLGAMSAARAEDRFYIDAVNIEPGETKTLAFNLDNSQEFYGFQADISFPEGIEIAMNGNKADITLSSRFDESYTFVSNMLSSGAVRLGTFSSSHTPISGNTGALIYMKVSASDSFSGGTISLTDVLFIDTNDRDVQLPDYSIDLGSVHNNSFYIPDFKIAVGETKTVSLVLDNETPFTAFQTDVYMPKGLTIETNSFVMSSRATGTHSVSAKSFSDGRTRIACLSSGSDVFAGNSGELLSFSITADKDAAETCQIELRNQIFSMSNAKEYMVPNSTTTVTTERALVESVTLNKTQLTLAAGENELLTATVLPSFASTKDVVWSSAAPEIATVSPIGLVTAVGIGSTVIKVEAVDGSGKFDECTVRVTGVPVDGITLSQSSATLKETGTLTLTATVSPANASDKSVVWESLNPEFATVDDYGTVTGIKVGQATIMAKSISNPEVSAECIVTVVPNPITKIEINYDGPTTLKVGDKITLTVSIYPENATDKSYIWETQDASILTVTPDGEVEAVGVGTAWVGAFADNGNINDTRIFTVEAIPVESISLSTTLLEINKGGTATILAEVHPENATYKDIQWETSDESIATVDNTGLVRAVETGTAMITARAGNISATCSVIVNELLSEVIWEQEIQFSLGKEYELTAYSSSGEKIAYKAIVPHGGYHYAALREEDNRWFFTATEEGAHHIQAYIVDKPHINVSQKFNVLDEYDDLMYIDGIYYRRMPNDYNSLRMVRGYEFYKGEITIPASANGMPVKRIDEYACYCNDELVKVDVKNGVGSIGHDAFNEAGVKEFHLPTSLTDIADYSLAFKSQTLEHLYVYQFTPAKIKDETFNTNVNYDTCVLHIPVGFRNSYINAPVWQNFIHIVDDLNIITGIPGIENDESHDVYSLTGVLLIKNASKEDIKHLLPGFYIVGGKKMFVK